MLEVLFSIGVLVGSVEIGPGVMQYDILVDNKEIITVIDDKRRVQHNFDC